MNEKQPLVPSGKPVTSVLKWVGAISAVIALVIGTSQVVGLYTKWKEKKNKVSGLINDSHFQKLSGDYHGAMKNLESALAIDPASEKIQLEQAKLSMQWLRDMRLSSARGENKFSDVVDKLLPSLYHAATITVGQEQADVLSHIGYANYLKVRDGQVDLKVDENFKEALSKDEDNVYAHTMWGFWLLFPSNREGDFTEGEKHFALALKSGREQKYVRYMHLSALSNCNFDYINEAKIFEVINLMRKHNDVIESEARERILSDAYSFEKGVIDSISSVLSPEDHLNTFNYLAKGIDLEQNHLLKFAKAQILERSGDFSSALKIYQEMNADSELEYFSRMEDIKKAIERLSH